MPSVLEFKNVSKKFAFNPAKPRSFLETVAQWGKRSGAQDNQFWVVRDLTLAIGRGEAVGIIGDNGAGKSTLLKLASRIIVPTHGQVVLAGRIGALLEVGVGFHPDLTGRENIYLNGAMIGLSRREMNARIEEIIAFSEIGDFIDVPVRHYSSGMLVRLGFAVATSISPDILLVDEVLAVGDYAFRYKCLERIETMRRQGTSILYVSHGLDEVRRVCDRVIWIEHGRARADGQADEVVRAYVNAALEAHGTVVMESGDAQNRGRRMGSGEVAITGVATLDAQGHPCDSFTNNSPFIVRIDYCCRKPIADAAFGLSIYAEDNTWITSPNSIDSTGHSRALRAGERGSIYYLVEHLPLKPGNYELTAAIFNPSALMYHPYDHLHRKYRFAVVDRNRPIPQDGWVELPHQWLDEPGWADKQARLP